MSAACDPKRGAWAVRPAYGGYGAEHDRVIKRLLFATCLGREPHATPSTLVYGAVWQPHLRILFKLLLGALVHSI